jgi:hypothetical protein
VRELRAEPEHDERGDEQRDLHHPGGRAGDVQAGEHEDDREHPELRVEHGVVPTLEVRGGGDAGDDDHHERDGARDPEAPRHLPHLRRLPAQHGRDRDGEHELAADEDGDAGEVQEAHEGHVRVP